MVIPRGPGVRRLCVFVAALVFAVAGSARAQTSDTTPPVLASLSFSPAKIDTSNASQQVTLTARMTDNLSGVQRGCFNFRSPSQQQFQGACLLDPQHLTTGSETDGIYQAAAFFPQFAEAGTWHLYSAFLVDDAGNPRSFNENDLVAAGFLTTLEVVSQSDVTPPTVEDLDYQPRVVDVSEGAEVINFSVQVSDEQSGVSSVCVTLSSPTDTYFQSGCHSDTDNEGTYFIDVTIPQYSEAGTWTILSVEVSDAVGNLRSYIDEELTNLEFPTELEVTSDPSDTIAPALLALDFTRSINTASANALATATARASDNLSGVSSVCVTFRSPSGLQQSRSGCPTLLAGGALDGVFEGTVQFPQYSESGVWTVTSVSVGDVVGNFQPYSEAALLAAGFPTTLTVSSGTPEMPTIVDVVPGDGRLTVSFSPGADGGSPITNYKYSINDGLDWITRDPAATTSPLVIAGLTNGNNYQLRLRAVNANGDGTPSLSVGGSPRAPAGVILDTFDPGADDTVYSVVLQPDGRILVGGDFSTIGGGGEGQNDRPRIARLNVDGSVDETFDTGDIMGPYSEVFAIARQADGRILVGGGDIADGRSLVRLNPDGSLDPTFDASPDSYVFALAVQPDGGIVVGGSFSDISVGGVIVPRRGLARLNGDGSIDAGFNPGLDSEGHVKVLALQSDGRILVGGAFFSLGGAPRDNLGRLESTGAIDPTFTTGVGSDSESFVPVTTITLQPDGRILVGGRFQTLVGAFGPTSRDNIARLNADGSPDATFVPPPEYQLGESSPHVETIVVLPNGQVVAGGFSVAMRVAGQPGHQLARFNDNGAVDAGFDAMVDGIVQEAALLPDGRLLIGGDFESVAGVPRIHLARIDVGIPGIPTLGPITPGSGQLSVAFTAPASGFPIVNYDYSIDGGATWIGREPASAASPLVITGLTSGVTYSMALRAVTATGPGIGSVPVAATPIAPPGAPVISAVTPGNNQLSVAFTAPGAVGGAAVSTYEFSTNGGGTWTPRTPVSTASPLVIPDLANGVTYQVALRAVNAAGAGLASAAVPGRPSTTPAAPLVTGVTPGNGQLTVVFLGGSDGGLPIATYEFSTNSGATWQPRLPAGTASPLVIAGLTNGTTYGLQLRAVNANGAGAASPTVPAVPQASLDETVDTFNPGADGEVRTLAVQADGRILAGGQFTRFGENATLPRNNLGRLNADGSVDATFDPVNIGPSSVVSAILVQADGGIVLAGDGPDPTGQRTYTARLHADGSFDGGFQGAANGPIHALAQEADGRILIGGNFTMVGLNNEWPRLHLARLNADGTADPSFNPGVDGIVNTIAVQNDGRILIGGAFTSVGAVPRSNLARLNADGSVDLGFVGGASGLTAAAVDVPGPFVATLWIQQDGKILVGGRFSMLGGGSASGVRHNVGRLHPDGTLDTPFDTGPGGSSSSAAFVESVLALPTRRILIGGVSVGTPHGDGTPRHLARLLPDGSLDAEFEPRADARVRALALQPDGKVVVGGQFNTIGGNTRHRIARLNGSGPPSLETPPAPIPFTDATLIAGVTPLRAIHVSELRTRINALRQRFGLTPVSWTDPVLTGVPARAVHVAELRSALQQAFDAALVQGFAAPRPVFAEAALGPGIPIRSLHIQQLRDAVLLLEGL